MNPFVSIITVNYNDAIGLQKTIDSVTNQFFKNYEYLVIDGNSNDGSKEVIQKNKSKINFWISEEDTGIYNAMNKGIEIAKGDYLLFLNSGDLLNGTMALSDFINHKDFTGDIIYGDYKFLEGGKTYPDNLTPLFFVRSSLPHQSTLFKKTVFDAMGLYDEQYKIVSDRAFYIKCFLSNQIFFKHINYPLSIFDLNGVSNNSSNNEKQLLENQNMFQQYYGVFYEDYKNMLLLQSQLNQVKRETLLGILKRIVNKIKRICRIH
ncbi:glycosyltransferase family 2 protein [Flavobacterium sp.]|uniref:glycosyltransferase family 2 protein n=1 Tax=Flavobacterium sp. TaxID=239 RepID=UPI00286C7E44|nr:glycosyltransferase family 2 protein [Flavobacterium sp.]